MTTWTIRTTLRPSEEITVGEEEYRQLLAQGLVDGEPVPGPPDPGDLEVAAYFQDETSETYKAVDELVAGLVAPGSGTQTEVELRAAFVAPAQINDVGALAGVSAMLDAAAASFAIQVVGDSTGVGTTRWPYLLAQHLAATYPAFGVRFRQWNDATQSFDAPAVLRTPPNGERKATLTGGAGSFLYVKDAAANRITGSLDVAIKAALADWTPATDMTLVSKFGGSGARSWRLYVQATTGRPVLQWSTDGGTSLPTATGTAAPTVTDGAALWLRATLDATTSTVTFYTSTDGSAWTQLGTPVALNGGAGTSIFAGTNPVELGTRATGSDSLIGDVYEVRVKNGIGGFDVVPRNPELWISSSGSITWSGSPTVDIINGSRSGANINYLNDATRSQLLTPDYGALVTFVSCAKNDGNRIGADWLADWDTLMATLRARHPSSAFVIVGQNPSIAPGPNVSQIAARFARLAGYASRNGYRFLDVYRAFTQDPRGVAALTAVDGIHPNDAAGSPLWASTVIGMLTRRS